MLVLGGKALNLNTTIVILKLISKHKNIVTF